MVEDVDNLQKLNVMLVEDDPDHVALIRHALAGQPVVRGIEHVADGAAALESLRDPARREMPDIVLLDLKLPRRGGLEVLEEVKSDPKLKMIPVIVLTTSAAEADMVKAYDLHANSYLVKPVQYEKFERLVRNMSLYWSQVNRLPEV